VFFVIAKECDDCGNLNPSTAKTVHFLRSEAKQSQNVYRIEIAKTTCCGLAMIMREIPGFENVCLRTKNRHPENLVAPEVGSGAVFIFHWLSNVICHRIMEKIFYM